VTPVVGERAFLVGGTRHLRRTDAHCQPQCAFGGHHRSAVDRVAHLLGGAAAGIRIDATEHHRELIPAKPAQCGIGQQFRKLVR
jgi:hypothetical protein